MKEIDKIKDLFKKCVIAGYDLDVITIDQLDELWNTINRLGEIDNE